ncbi:MAG: metallophosphoesterase [Bacteroidota bacterium]
MKKIFYPYSWIGVSLFLLSVFSFGFHQPDTSAVQLVGVQQLRGVDGPYVFTRKGYKEIIRVQKRKRLGGYGINRERIPVDSLPLLKVVVDNQDQDSFFVQLRDKYITPPTHYEEPENLLAIGDIEGNFNAFYSLLINNRIMDSSYNWTYGKGHLVLVGDFVDRGHQVTEVLWLIYHLETEAAKQGGMVHYILGNHEVMDIQGGTYYVQDKYIELAKRISGQQNHRKAMRFMMSKRSAIGAWLRSKNVIEKIGPIVFVHAGLSPALRASGLTLEQVNKIARRNIERDLLHYPSYDEEANLVMGEHGPLWYRGLLVSNREHYPKATQEDLEKVLAFYKARYAVIGHTLVPTVTNDYYGRLFCIDIKQPHQKNTGKAQALMLEEGMFYRVNDFGIRGNFSK